MDIQELCKDSHGILTVLLIYGTEAISPLELVVPTPRVVLEESQEDTKDTNNGRSERRSQRYQQRMTKAYTQAVRPRAFTEGQLVLRIAEHVRKNLSGPSKFALKWEGPYIIRKAHDSGYYYLTKEDGTVLTEPINGKWLKQYYA